jgi:hypothetical protein
MRKPLSQKNRGQGPFFPKSKARRSLLRKLTVESLEGRIVPSTLQLGTNFEGLHFTDQPSRAYPPDNALAVGNGYIVQAVNASEIRISDMTGKALLTENMNTLFGLGRGNGGDIFVVYDDIANRWYAGQLDANVVGYEFAWSKDSNPLDGFNSHFFNLGYIFDFPKIGYNFNGVFITGDKFLNNTTFVDVQVLAINKANLLSSTPTVTSHLYAHRSARL